MDLQQGAFSDVDIMQMKNLPNANAGPPGLLRKFAAFVVTLVLLGLALMFSVLVLAVVLTAGAMALGYFWWRTRELRKQMREHPAGGAVIEGEVIKGEVIDGEIIEGEVIRENDSRDGK